MILPVNFQQLNDESKTVCNFIQFMIEAISPEIKIISMERIIYAQYNICLFSNSQRKCTMNSKYVILCYSMRCDGQTFLKFKLRKCINNL